MIALQDRQRLPVDQRRLRRTLRVALHALGVWDHELSLTLVDDREIRRLNARFRGVRRRTDAEMPWESLTPLLIWSAMRMECGWRWMELTLPTSRPATRTGSPGATSLASLKTAFTV